MLKLSLLVLAFISGLNATNSDREVDSLKHKPALNIRQEEQLIKIYTMLIDSISHGNVERFNILILGLDEHNTLSLDEKKRLISSLLSYSSEHKKFLNSSDKVNSPDRYQMWIGVFGSLVTAIPAYYCRQSWENQKDGDNYNKAMSLIGFAALSCMSVASLHGFYLGLSGTSKKNALVSTTLMIDLLTRTLDGLEKKQQTLSAETN